MRKNRIYPEDQYGAILEDSDGNIMTFFRYLKEELISNNILKDKEQKIYYLINFINLILVYPLLKLLGYLIESPGYNQSITNPIYLLAFLIGTVFLISLVTAGIFLFFSSILLLFIFIKTSFIYTRVKFSVLILFTFLESYLIYKFLYESGFIISYTFHLILIIVLGTICLALLILVILEFYSDLEHKRNYQLTIEIQNLINSDRVEEALIKLDSLTMKEAENTASKTIIVHYLKRNDFAKAIDLSEKMNFGYDEIVNAYLKEGNVSQAIKFAEKNDNDALDIVVDYLNDENKFNEAIELNIKLKDQWDRVWNMKETAKKSALAGQIEITKKAIQQIIQYDKYKNSSYGDWKILYEIAIMLEEKSLYPEHVAKLLTSTKEHVLSFEDDYDKKASIENFNEDVDDSKMPNDSKKRFKELFKV
jgi:hypothetical protein